MHHPHRFCVAPMLRCTDRHFRYLARLLTKHSMLYTEMITTGTLIHGEHDRWLDFHACEHPIALQLGGSDPIEMAKCAEYATEYKFDEININVGCPSDRVQAGKFGACLMLEPTVVADCIKAMKNTTNTEITVKTRIGVDDQDDYKTLRNFVETIAASGCKTVIVHARKAYLSGLSPKENRTIPPLHYEYVYLLKEEFPDLKVIINGGIDDMEEIQKHLQLLDGVMVGREAYDNPFFLSEVDARVFGSHAECLSRNHVLNSYKKYIQLQLDNGVPLKVFVRHLFGLFNGKPGAKAWRRYLSENAYKKDAGVEIINEAANFVTGISGITLAS